MEKVKFKIIDSKKVYLLDKDKRKTKGLRKKLSEAIKDVEKIIELGDAVQGNFYHSISSSANRRYEERKMSFETEYEFDFVKFSLSQNVSLSATYYYVNKEFIINEERYNLRKVKSLFEELNKLSQLLNEPKKYEVYLSKKELKELENEIKENKEEMKAELDDVEVDEESLKEAKELLGFDNEEKTNRKKM